MEKRGNTNAKGIKKSFRGGGNRLESSPQRGEEAIVHERLARVTSAGEGKITAKFVKDVRSIRRKGDKFETEKVVLVDSSNEHELDLPNNKTLMQENWLHILSEGEKEVVNELERILQPQERGWQKTLQTCIPLSHIRSTRYSLVNDCDLSLGEVSLTIFDNSCNSRHSERQRKNPAYYCNTSKLNGIHMNNLTETGHASMPLGIFASKYDVGIAMPTYFAVYPSKSSLIREDLCYSKVVHDNNFNLTETVHSPFTTHNSLKKSAFTLAEVLITLGIIGVVAAITLPSLIQRNIEKQRVAQLKKAYSELSQAYNLAIAENGSPTEWGMGGMYEEKSHYIMANNMRKFLKLSVDCVDMTAEQTRVNCGHDNLYRNNSYQYGKGIRRLVVLSDGVIVNIRTYSGLCNVQYSAIKNVCGVISVDLNGATPPNRNGEDKFEIFITRDRLVPAGIDGALLSFEKACNRKIAQPFPGYSDGNMYACTAWVLYNENMDYLHCDDLSWEGKHSCK